MMRRGEIVIIAIIVAVAAIVAFGQIDGKTPEPRETKVQQAPADPEDAAAAIETSSAIYADLTGGARADARRVVREAMKRIAPGVKVRGISTLYLDGSTFLATVDLPDLDPIILLARPFIGDEGETYWRADPLSPIEATLMGQGWRSGKAARDSVEQASEK